MTWFICLVAIAALAALHLAWRKRLHRARSEFHRQLEQFQADHQQEITARDNQENALLDSMVEGLLVLDNHGRIRLANRAFAALAGTSSDLRGNTLLETLRIPALPDLAARLTQKKQIEGVELRLDGNDERWVEVSGAALSNADGTPNGTLLVFHDLSRVKKLERIRQEFVANVSHELRTPLSLIKGYAETLLEGAKDDPELSKRFLETIDRNAERLKALIEDLLTISELESNRVTLSLQPVAAKVLTAKILADLAARAAPRQVALINSVTEVTVLADAGRLEQVLINLVDNGIKYGRPGGTVEILARRLDNDEVEFTVRDDGPGISAAALDRIFERFYREDKARSREQGGTGLGLSIVKHIVQSHGGRVWARSEPGHGAAFYFTIPRA